MISIPCCWGDKKWISEEHKYRLFMPKKDWWEHDGYLYKVRRVDPKIHSDRYRKEKWNFKENWFITTKMTLYDRYASCTFDEEYVIDSRLYHAYDCYTLEGYNEK